MATRFPGRAGSLSSRLLSRVLERRGLAIVSKSDATDRPGPADRLPAGYFEERPFDDLVDYGEERALELLRVVFPAYRGEYESFPREPSGDGAFHLCNDFFGPVDAEVLYCMVRNLAPREVVEVGSGFSSLLVRMALDANPRPAGRLTCIDPDPRAAISAAADTALRSPVETLEAGIFSRLGEGDILFVDSSHVLATGGDLNFIFFEVLPLLQPGAIVHFHDICLPRDYLREWVLKERRGYTEQYLLLAFLVGNDDYEVVWPGLYMMLEHPREIMDAFPSCTSTTAPVSFWLRKLR